MRQHYGHAFFAYKVGACDFTGSSPGLSAISALIDDKSGASGTVANAAAIEVVNGSMPGGATFTNKMGLYIGEQTG